jgi:hypothetical protein
MNVSALWDHADSEWPAGCGQAQLITLAVEHSRRWDTADAIWAVLLAVQGVQLVEADPARARLWVFADGTVEPDSLVAALAGWGYRAWVLDHELKFPE